MALYDDVAPHYDHVRRADPTITRQLWRMLQIGTASRALDLACGTGNYTLALQAFGGHWVGLDANASMLGHAILKRADLSWVAAQGESLPFADACFDAVATVLSIHHYTAMQDVFTEIRRVSHGRFATFACTREQTANYWIWHYFPRLKEPYLATLPSQEEMTAALQRASFGHISWIPYRVTPDLRDGFLYRGKYDPSIYLDSHCRAGISTFSVLDDPTLFTDGLDELHRDYLSGAWRRWLARANDDVGDYLYGLAEC